MHPFCASGLIVGPYALDGHTLHLWHLDETSAPALDSVLGGTNLTALANGALLGGESAPGFGNALSTATATNAYLAPRPLVVGIGDDTAMSFADPLTGAFTYEALVRVDFDPDTNFSRTLPLYLITAENDSGQPNSARAFQFRIMPNGAPLTGTTTSDYRLHFFNAKDNGSCYAVIPRTGSNAITVGNWFHVAVTYDGRDGEPGNTRLYWTPLRPDRVTAHELPGAALVAITDLSTTATPDFTLGNVGRTTPNSSWPGLIDEVRISKIARTPADMVFNTTNAVAPVTLLEHPRSQMVGVGQAATFAVTAFGTEPLRYQWRFDGTDLPGARQSTYTVSSAQLTNAGDYCVVVTNAVNATTSTVANLRVAISGPVTLRIAPADTNFLLTWPVSIPEWTLHAASNLASGAAWHVVTNPVVTPRNENRVVIPRQGSQTFFRLVALTAVRPINWAAFQTGLPSDANAQRAAAILRNACRYALTTWWTNKYAAQDAADYLNLGGTGENNVRPPGMEAYGLAVALQTGIYDPALAGVPEVEARNRALKMVRSVGYRHRVNQPGGWGNAWQSAHWAALAGTAGWMLWPHLSAVDQEYVRRMVEYEANRFTNYAVPYYMNRTGVIISTGDTKTEENAWNASVLHLAVCMMPAHPNAPAWRTKALELTLSTHARPSDINRTDIYHGRTLASWLNGSNANEDSTVINHGFVHPDYMAAGLCEFQPALVYLLAGESVPLASFLNLDAVYDAMVDLNFVVGATPYPTGLTNRPPGGPIYMRDVSSQPTDNLYYPNGNDWGTSRRMHFATLDATVRVFGLDGPASIPASLWEAQHGQIVLDMQARFPDGRTYGAASEDTYSLREEWVCNHAGKCCLTQWLVHQGRVQISNAP